MDPLKIKAILDLRRPETKKEVKQYLGFFGFYRVFLPAFADVAIPFTELTKKEKPNVIVWTPELENVFYKLKTMVCSQYILTDFEIGCVTNLYCDSSDFAAGAVLTQLKDKKLEKPIAFIRTTTL